MYTDAFCLSISARAQEGIPGSRSSYSDSALVPCGVPEPGNEQAARTPLRRQQSTVYLSAAMLL